MTEGMANAIMCCKYWLGFEEFAHQDLTPERRLAEEGLEGDERDCTIEVDDE